MTDDESPDTPDQERDDKAAIVDLVKAIEVFAGMPELQDQYAITLKIARALIARYTEQADG